MNIDEIQQIFFQECEEGLGVMETSFAAFRDDAHDDETINTVFRAVHSIKGGAGAFGHERLQAFTHQYETLLDLVRTGSVGLDEALLGMIIAAFDVLADHVAAARDGTAAPADAVMLSRLEAATCSSKLTVARAIATVPSPSPVAAADDGFDDLFDMLDIVGPSVSSSNPWIVEVRPDFDALAYGGDPLLLLRELATLGSAIRAVDTTALPMLDVMDPGHCYLAWTVTVPGDVAEDDIRAIFEFSDEGILRIVRGVDDREAARPTVIEDAAASSAPLLEAEPAREASNDTQAIASIDVPAAAKLPSKGQVQSPGQTIRVDLDKLDRLVNLVGELVITQAMLAQRLSEHSLVGVTELTDLEHLTRELQESTMAIRAQPMKTVFSRVPRIIRELEIETGKRVRLDVEGEMTEVDKTVVERIGEPLTHLIRNAVDHGLETPAERLALGKTEEGVVRLSAMHHSGRIVITVADDGRGIDRDRVRAKAVERGIIASDAQMSDEEIDNLIFAPGFSTAQKLSSISGRGVGMDVVRKNVQALGGRIGIQSQCGRGSSFALSLPLTLAVVDGMIVTVGDQTFVIPLSHIVESLRPAPGAVREMSSGCALFDVRGTYVPVHRVATQLGIVGAQTEPSLAVLIVVESDGGQAVLMVDAIQDQRQVVVKSLEANYEAIHGLAGATILGDGRVALILEIDALTSRWRRDERLIPLDGLAA
ncbi:chemotaxis protein CheA [Sphingomonas sp. PP-CC-3G-468]|uniref:chemotaxis protein CheA n=1 Tax=Sphingomonas sp. PP-CC-3G-468 TaxID=2135656 RepID=UPI00104914DA|nr:chemotaxis protein CheA [Sphingomonas sp. PP-CC-3G-468]TCM00503.1 two-component system chemotaxis sensor kinase CheA [Sphingomonas sp. PP-CC-3G-468]